MPRNYNTQSLLFFCLHLFHFLNIVHAYPVFIFGSHEDEYNKLWLPQITLLERGHTYL